jgi:hypothetical protein
MALRVDHAYQQATDWHLQAPPTRPRLFGSRPAPVMADQLAGASAFAAASPSIRRISDL